MPSTIQTVVFHFQAGKTGDVSRKIQIKTDLATDNAVSDQGRRGGWAVGSACMNRLALLS